MNRALIGRTVRRLRGDRQLSQQALASRLGISASYLNLIEHDQRAVTASLLIKLAETLRVDLGTLSGTEERQIEVGLREAFADPLLGAEAVPEEEAAALAGSAPNAARAVLALYRAWRVAREDAGGIALPSGRRILLPNEEARDLFNDRGNYFPALEAAAEALVQELAATPAEMNHAIAERLRRQHGLSVVVQKLDGAFRRYDPAARLLVLAESLPRESRGFQMAFQLALLEAREAVEAEITAAAPSSPEAAMLMRVGLLNYVAGAVLMPYAPSWRPRWICGTTWKRWRRASAGRSSRPATGCPRCSGRARGGCRSSSCASIRRAMSRSGSRRRGSRSRAMAGHARAGWCTRRSPPRGRCACRWPSCPMVRRSCASRAPSSVRRRAGAIRAPVHVVAMGCALAQCRESWPTPTASTSSGRGSASGCRAGCATGRTAAAAPSRRWSIGWRWTR